MLVAIAYVPWLELNKVLSMTKYAEGIPKGDL